MLDAAEKYIDGNDDIRIFCQKVRGLCKVVRRDCEGFVKEELMFLKMVEEKYGQVNLQTVMSKLLLSDVYLVRLKKEEESKRLSGEAIAIFDCVSLEGLKR